MTPIYIRSSLALACSLALVGCQPFPAAVPGPSGTVASQRAVAAGEVLFRGHVQYPSAMRRVLAASSDVAVLGTVTLLEGTTPKASGLTDAEGDFTLYQATTPFVPVNGTCYTLEVSRRGPNASVQDLLSLRTVMRYVDGAWTSVTGSTIVVSTTTTGIALDEAVDDGITPEAVIGMVSGGTVTPIEGLNVNAVEASASTVNWLLANDIDPVAAWTNGEVITGDVSIPHAEAMARYRNARVITGNLTVVTSTKVMFPYLQRVNGQLAFHVKPDGAPGLGALRSVGSMIVTPNIESLDGFQGLRQVDGRLEVYGGVQSLEGLEHLETIGGNLDIAGAPVTSLVGLSGLKSVSQLVLRGLNIPSFEGLESLTTVNAIDFQGAIELLSLEGLSGLVGDQSGLTISIMGAPKLNSVTGLGNVTALKQLTLYSVQGASLNLAGLPSTLTTLEGLDIQGSPMTSLAAPNLHTITKSLRLSSMPLADLGLSGLTAIGVVGQPAPTVTINHTALDCEDLDNIFDLIQVQNDAVQTHDVECGGS